MTKKSKARQLRDLQEKQAKKQAKAMGQTRNAPNNCWSELNQIHSDCMRLLLSHQVYEEYAKTPSYQAAFEDLPTFAKHCAILGTDLVTMHDELKQIKAMHEGLVGGTEDPEENMRAVTIGEHYAKWMQKHDAVIMPTLQILHEAIDKAGELITQAQAQIKAKEDAINPNVITDVVVTEVAVDAPAEA